MMRIGSSKLIVSIVLAFTVLCTWEFLVAYLEVPAFILPGPTAVFKALWRGVSGGLYFQHAWVTILETLIGFSLAFAAALTLGTAIAVSRRVEFFLYPYIVMMQSMPKVAVAPLLVLWFGLGIASKIAAVALICFFPLLVNTIAGLKSADPDRVNLMRSLQANEWQIFTMLRLPNALPMIAAGVEIAIIFAMLGAIVAEFVGAQAGLGVLLQLMAGRLDVAGQFSLLILLSIIGLIMSRIVIMVSDRLLFWDPARRARKANQNGV